MSFDKVVKLACKPKAAPPKAKYIDAIITATYADDGSVHDICRALAGRLREPNSIVVFKALITLHQMIRSGSTDNILGHLSQQDILKLRNVSSQPWEGYSPPSNLTHYARYLDVRIRGYKDLQHDPVRVQADSNRMSKYEGTSAKARKLRQLTVDKGLLREVKQVQRMIDSLLDCKLYDDDLHDECTVVSLRMLLKDLLVLFQAGNEGVINVLEHYFEMSKTDATDALAVYKSFCKQTDNVVEYLSMARKLVNLLNVPVPNLKHAPVSLAKALEEYLQDPNFEQNRIEYKANMGAVDGLSAAPSKSPASTSTPASQPAPKATPAPAAAATPAPTNQRAIQDFFESIQADQQPNMFAQQTGQGYSQSSMSSMNGQAAFNPFRQSMIQPQQTGYMGMGMQPQQTGWMGMQPQMTGFQQGSAFQQQAAFSPQAQPSMSPSGGPWQMQGSTAFLQPQPTSNLMQQQQQPLQAQSTGSNPFRQSTFFPPTQAPIPAFSQQPATGASTSPFGANPSWQTAKTQPAQHNHSSQTAATVQQPLTAQPTGSKNPFAPPGGAVPAVPSVPSQFASKGPSLRELAEGGQSNNAPSPFASFGPQTPANGSSGGMSDIASAFISNKPSSPFGPTGGSSWLTQSQAQSPAVHSEPFGSSGLQSQPTGFLQPQATGFTSSVKPFKPTSSFGSTLIESLPPLDTVKSQQTGFGQMSSQPTGSEGLPNPFRKTMQGGAPNPTGMNSFGGASAFGNGNGNGNGLAAFGSHMGQGQGQSQGQNQGGQLF